MILTSDPRVRPLVLVLVLVVAAAGAALMVFMRANRSSDEAAPAPVATTAPRHTAPKHVATSHPAVKPRPKPRPKVAASPDPYRLPAAIRQALAADRVVVVALYDPKAKLDHTAIGEAKAGARLADTSFVPVNVRTNGVTSLNARYGVLHDPAVLVLRPPGELVVRIDGFADRDTVAQAAVNASS